MTNFSFLVLFFVSFAAVSTVYAIKYEPTWESVDSRPLPDWYDDAKVGVFIHWGVFSVPSYDSEWFWAYWKQPGRIRQDVLDFMAKNYRPDWTYADFANQFTTEFYNANDWADTLNSSGAKYVVLTSKHHEGFTNWPSKYSFNWNAMDVGPKRDLVGELATAVRSRTDIRFGLYHSLFEWFNPLYLQDDANNFSTDYFVHGKTMPELYEIVNAYKPEVVWSDGANGPDSYWNAAKFLAWLYNESPVKDTVVVNDRWFAGCACHHGGYYTCQDRYNPGKLVNHKWENCLTLDKYSWGYRRNSNLHEYLTIDELLNQLASSVSCGGNLLVNIGPTHDGRIVPIFQERLEQLGQWLSVNGQAIYSSRPWIHQNDTVTKNVWYTYQNRTTKDAEGVYAIVLDWPVNNKLYLGAPITSEDTQVKMLGMGNTTLQWVADPSGGMTILFPFIPVSNDPRLPKYAWVLQMTNLKG